MGSRFASLLLVCVALSGATRVASAEWPPCGRGISTAPATQTHATITTEGADGAIVTWQDSRFARVNIFAQHVLASGEVDGAWPVDGRALLNDPPAIA